MKVAWGIAKRAAIVATVTATALAIGWVPSAAADGEASVTVTDQPGAPGEMLQQLERLTGRPVGTLEKVVAVDTAGQSLTIDQAAALVAGEEVDGVRVLGTMPGSQDLLDTTMADLSDGWYDGPGDAETSTSTLLFATSIPDGREWCLTMCIASGKTVRECILARLGGDGWLTFELSGDTTLGATKAALERANESSLGALESVATLVGDSEPSVQDIEMLADGKDVASLRKVADLARPDLDWAIGDVAGKSGVVYAKATIHIFTFDFPFLGKILAVCITKDGGKTWKCTGKQWDGF